MQYHSMIHIELKVRKKVFKTSINIYNKLINYSSMGNQIEISDLLQQ